MNQNLSVTNAASESELGDLGQQQVLDPSVVTALLFDLGGVLIGLDFDRILQVWAAKANCDIDEVRARFRHDEAYEQHERGELDAAGYFATLRDTLGIDLSDADFLLGWNDIFLDPIEGMASLLHAASQSFPLYVFTNSNPSHRERWSVLRNELQYFEAVFVSSDLGVRKPDPNAFLVVAKLAGHKPWELLFFDDTPANVVGARTAGLQAVLVRSIQDVRRALSSLGVRVD